MKPQRLSMMFSIHQRYIPFLLLTMMLIALSACSTDTVGPESTNTIMPLKVGNQWIYQVQDIRSNGEIVSTEYDTMKIVSTQKFNGEVWYQSNAGTYYTNRADGLWFRGDTTSNREWQLARYPASASDVFGRDTSFRTNGTSLYSFYRVGQANRSLTVPAGTYTTYTYWWVDGNLNWIDRETSYAPGIGLVQLIRYQYDRLPPIDVINQRSDLIAVTLQ